MKLLRALFVPAALVVVGIIRLIRPLLLVRFGELMSSRIGHLVGNTEAYLCERDAGMHPKAYDIFLQDQGRCANRFVYRKYRKLIHVWPAWFGMIVVKVNRMFTGWEKHEFSDVQFGRDIHNLFPKHAPHIGLTQRDLRRGERLLRSLGIPPGAKWVCLIVRDGAYLKQHKPGADFSHHDYRDADVSNCIPAAVMLSRMGYYVIRMGAAVAKPFAVKHTHIIDYAMGKRTEFGDLFLGAKCEFAISNGTGWDEIPRVFQRPICYVNFVPLELMGSFTRGVLIWKHHVKDGKRMTLPEIYASGASSFAFAHLFKQAGITLEENSQQEIVDAVVEIVDMVQGAGLSGEPAQQRFWDAFPRTISPYNYKPMHGKIVLRIGREFLKQYDEVRQ